MCCCLLCCVLLRCASTPPYQTHTHPLQHAHNFTQTLATQPAARRPAAAAPRRDAGHHDHARRHHDPHRRQLDVPGRRPHPAARDIAQHHDHPTQPDEPAPHCPRRAHVSARAPVPTERPTINGRTTRVHNSPVTSIAPWRASYCHDDAPAQARYDCTCRRNHCAVYSVETGY